MQQSSNLKSPSMSGSSSLQIRDEAGLHTMRSSRSSSPQPAESLAPTAEQYYDEDIEDEIDPLLARIHTGNSYTNRQLSGNLPIMQTTRFRIPRETLRYKPSATEARTLSLLRKGPATIIMTSNSIVVYEIGMPIPYLVPEGAGVRLVHTPHWWVGKSPAEVRAGPHAEEADIRKQASKIKELETKARKKLGKTLREIEIERKLEEGLRRQEEGLKVYNEVDARWL